MLEVHEPIPRIRKSRQWNPASVRRRALAPVKVADAGGDTGLACTGLSKGNHVEIEPTTVFQSAFSAISSSAPIFLKSRNSSAFLNHFPEYVSGVGLRSGMRRASTVLKPCFSSNALYSASDSACTGTFNSVTQRSE